MSHTIAIKDLSFDYLNLNQKDKIKNEYKINSKVLDELSISIREGELTCLLGANGAGKTTLINLILGRLNNQHGKIELFGQYQNAKQVQYRIGAMLQNSTAPDKAKVIELIELFSSYYPKPLDTHQLIKQLNLTGIIDKQFGKLSGGQKQLVLLALALCGDPDLLFLDEPSVGMDVEVRRTLWSVIESYKAQGKTIILTTHYLDEADALADRVLVLQQGKIIADGTPCQIKDRFQTKQIIAKTNQSKAWVAALDEVVKVESVGQYLQVTSNSAEKTLKQWLTQDESISDVKVIATNLEQAFMQLTQESKQPDPKQADISQSPSGEIQ